VGRLRWTNAGRGVCRRWKRLVPAWQPCRPPCGVDGVRGRDRVWCELTERQARGGKEERKYHLLLWLTNPHALSQKQGIQTLKDILLTLIAALCIVCTACKKLCPKKLSTDLLHPPTTRQRIELLLTLSSNTQRIPTHSVPEGRGARERERRRRQRSYFSSARGRATKAKHGTYGCF